MPGCEFCEQDYEKLKDGVCISIHNTVHGGLSHARLVDIFHHVLSGRDLQIIIKDLISESKARMDIDRFGVVTYMPIKAKERSEEPPNA